MRCAYAQDLLTLSIRLPSGKSGEISGTRSTNTCALTGAVGFGVLNINKQMPAIQARALILAELARLKKARELGRDQAQNLASAEA